MIRNRLSFHTDRFLASFIVVFDADDLAVLFFKVFWLGLDTNIWIPVIFNEVLSFGKHHIELGLGHVFTYAAVQNVLLTQDTFYLLPSYTWEWGGFFAGRIGYRYQKPQGHLIIRAGFTPFIEYEYTSWLRYGDRLYLALHPSAGLAIGHSF